MTLVFLSLGWLLGLYLGQTATAGGVREGTLQNAESWLMGLAALAGLAAIWGRDDRTLRITALAVGVAVLGIWRAFAVVPEAGPLERLAGPVVAQGTIASRPEPRDTALLLVLDVDQLRQGRVWKQMRARVLVRTDRYAEWSYGDRVEAQGTLRPVDEGSSYWAEYLARQGIHSTLEGARLRLEERPSSPDPLRLVDGLRGRIDSVCAVLFPEPQASLLAGILVGSRASMPTDFRDALNATSTSHIVAVSGFNVTVVAGIVQLLALRFLGMRKATLLSIVAVWFYSILTGLPPSALRASIMATMALSAALVGRGGDTFSFLCFSAAVMAGLDPQLLRDLGFQLSFLATAGLVLLEPTLRGWLGRLPTSLAASLSVTLAAQLATLPVLVLNFHTLSLVSPLTNLLIAPMLPGLMGIGALAVGLGALVRPLGELVAPVAWLYLTYLVEVIRWTARIPGAATSTGGLEPLAAAFYFLILLAVALWPLPEIRGARDQLSAALGRLPRWALVGAVAALLSLGVVGFSGSPDGKSHVHFLDVGHGDATLIRGPDGHQLLVDGGPSPTAVASALGRRLGFLDRGLDAVVLTGYGQDRLAGMLEVARRYPIGLVLQPGSPPRDAAGRAWAELVRDRGLPVMRAAVGQRVVLGDDAWLEVVWTSSTEAEEEPALALKLMAGGTGVLLLGDLSRAAQVDLARVSPGRMEVLRVPRHGAAGSLDERLLQMSSPRVAVVSVRSGNNLGHPAESTLQLLRSASLLRTDRHGTVELAIDRNGYEVFTDR